MNEVENRSIKERIDKTQDHIIDIAEVRDFVLEDENQSENIKELGDYLNNLPDRYYDEIRDNLVILMGDPEIIDIYISIEEKVYKNEKLNNDELSIIYLEAMLYGKYNGFINTGKFDLGLPIEKICNGYLLGYIQKRYNNYNYNPNKNKLNQMDGPVNKPQKVEKPYQNPLIPNPFPLEPLDEQEQLETAYQGLPQIPEGKEIDISVFDKFLKWGNENYAPELIKLEEKAKDKHRFKDKKYLSGYIKYEKLSFILKKYYEIITKKDDTNIIDAGYANREDFEKEVKKVEEFNEFLKTIYGKSYLNYINQLTKIKNKYFEKEEDIIQAEKEYTDFRNEEKEIEEESGMDMAKVFNENGEMIEWNNLTEEDVMAILNYSIKMDDLREKYGDSMRLIKNYEGFMLDISKVEKVDESILKKINKLSSGIDFEKYNKYCELSSSTKTYEHIMIANGMQKVLTNVDDPNFPIPLLKEEKDQRIKEQEQVDLYRNTWKNNDIISYRVAQIISGLENVLVDGLLGTITALMPIMFRYDEDEMVSFNDRRGQFLGSVAGFAGIERRRSTSQSEPLRQRKNTEGPSDIIDFLMGFDPSEFHLTRDNVTEQATIGVGNMLLLIYGGGFIGAELGGGAIASKVGLFASSMFQQAGNSYLEGISGGLNRKQALTYSFLSSITQSGLELVSPNEILLGKGSGLGKQLIKSLCNNGNINGIKLAGKYILTSCFKEIREENIQEALQLAAGNLINEIVNNTTDSNLSVDWSANCFLETAIITTLTTGITTGFTAGNQGIKIFNSSQQELIGRVFSTPGLYEDVINVLDNSIEGKLKIPNVQSEKIQGLKMMLTYIHENQIAAQSQTEIQANGIESQNNNTENQVNEENNINEENIIDETEYHANTDQNTQHVIEQQETSNEGKTNVEQLAELGIKIPEDSKEKINKMELDYLNLGNQNIDNISTSDFEILVNNSTEFPKYLITAELINNILNTINISQSRLLIEKFSINNDADLFNSILRQRELQAIENLNKENGLIPIYDQLFNELEKLEYNENNIDEFTKTLERYNNYINENDRNRLVEAFPNKSEINEILKFLSNETLSDTIIDYHFNDISYNVFLDLKELLNYQVTNGVTIPIEHLKIYRDILNIDNLSIEEKINLHNELKNINVIEMFYNDYTSSRDRMYQEIADSILNKEKLEQFRDSELSEQYGISIYKFDGQEFFALARESGLITNTGKTKGFSFSLVGKDCIGTRGSSHLGKGKPVNAFIYGGLDPQSIMHVFPKDSHTNSQYQPRRNDNNRHNFDQHVNTLMSPTELLKSTQDYNEIFILRNGNDGNGYGSIGEIRPIALYCYDEITPEDIEIAKSENVGIVLIKTDCYKKDAVDPERGVDYVTEKHMYIDRQSQLDDAIEYRGVITTFEKEGELNDIINGDNQTETQNNVSESLKTEEIGKGNNESNMFQTNIDKDQQQIIESLGKIFHEARRNSMIKPDGSFESRIEPVTDQGRIQEHNGQTEIDILNTEFDDLPVERKQENLEAAKVAVDLVYEKVVNGEKFTIDAIEEMACIVHYKRLERNGLDGSFANQRVPYSELSEEEKAKDRNQVIRAIQVVEQILSSNNLTINQNILLKSEELKNIEELNKLGLTIDEVINLKRIQDLGVALDENDIDNLKGMKLTDEETENIRMVANAFKNLGLFVDSGSIDALRTFTPNDVDNVRILQSLGVHIDMSYINNLKGLTEQDMKNIIELDKIGIKAYIVPILNVKGLEQSDIDNIKKLLKDLEIEIDFNNIQKFKGLSEDDITNIISLKNKIGIDIYDTYIDVVKGLSNQDMLNIDRLNSLFGGMYISDIVYLKGLSKNDMKNITKLNELGICVNFEDIPLVKGLNLKESEFENLEDLTNLGIVIYPSDITKMKGVKLSDIPNNVEYLVKSGFKISSSILFDIMKVTENDIKNIFDLKNYIHHERDILNLLGLSEADVQNIKKYSGKSNNINTLKSVRYNIDILEIDSENYLGGYDYSDQETYTHQIYNRGTIIETVQQYVQNVIRENRNIFPIEIITTIRPCLSILSPQERLQILSTIYQIVDKYNTIRSIYLDFEKGPYRTPKDLLCAITGLTSPEIIGNITDDITVRQHGSGLVFFIGDKRSYQIIHDNSLIDSGVRSGGFNNVGSFIEELSGTLSVINGKDPGIEGDNFENGTVRHEGQHNRNSYFMSDKYNTPITRVKDEIIAYLRDGTGIFNVEKWNKTIEQILTTPKSEGGLYQYGLEGQAREAHKAQVRQLLSYANDLIELTKDPRTGLKKENVISMLSDSDVSSWDYLHSLITESVQLHIDRSISKTKIEGLKDRFVAKITERAGNNRLINNLVNFWNSLFPDYGIKLEEFRRAGTAKPETVIDNLENCNSLDEILHVLRDPQYSHIGWGLKNLGGIEVSHIIDEVVLGNLPINEVPPELRKYIEKFYTLKGANEGNNSLESRGTSFGNNLNIDPNRVEDRGGGIYYYKTETGIENQGTSHIQETIEKINELITKDNEEKFTQIGFTKEYPDNLCKFDVDRFITRAKEKEIAHKQIFLDLGRDANAQALFMGPSKDAYRIVEKVNNDYLPVGMGLDAITDFTRSTLLFDNYSEFIRGVELLKQMQKDGRISNLRIKNRINLSGCNDLFINIQTPDGYVSEVQFHVPESLVFKGSVLGLKAIEVYQDKYNMTLDEYYITEDIYDLSSQEYQSKINEYQIIIDRLNKVKKPNHKFELPEQGGLIHSHELYNITRILEKWNNEPKELTDGIEYKYVESLRLVLTSISDSLWLQVRDRYTQRTT